MPTYIQHSRQVSDYSQVSFWRKTHPLDLVFVCCGLLVVALVLVSYLLDAARWLPHDPQAIDMDLLNASIRTHGRLLGPGFMGRDILSRLIVGIQAYFLPGLLAIAIALTGGSLCGLLSGYWRGRWERVVTYGINLIDSFPRLVMILLMVVAFKPDIYISRFTTRLRG